MLRLDLRGPRGSATVEQVGLALLLGALFAALIAALLTGSGERPGHGLGIRIANRIACGPREPGSCRHHPAVSAYGWDVARAVRWLAPPVEALTGPGGTLLVPVDFRYCQGPGCAAPSGGDGRLTTANRRTTLFTEVHRVNGGGSWEIVYWSYRPSLGWRRTTRRAGPEEIDSASGTRLLLEDSPRLVPLEILPGRNHYELPAGDEPPWRWRVDALHEGWSA